PPATHELLLLLFTTTAPTQIHPLSLHDALPISENPGRAALPRPPRRGDRRRSRQPLPVPGPAHRRLSRRGRGRRTRRRSREPTPDRKSTRLNSSHRTISYAVFCLKKKKKNHSHC